MWVYMICNDLESWTNMYAARDPAVPAAGVLQGVPVEAGGGGRRRAGPLHHHRRALHHQRRRQRLRAELLHQPVPLQDADRRPVLRPPRPHLPQHRLGEQLSRRTSSSPMQPAPPPTILLRSTSPELTVYIYLYIYIYIYAATVRHGSTADRRDVAAAAGVPAGGDHAVRARQQRVRVEAERGLAELQPEDERHRGRAVAAVPGPEDRRVRHLHAALRPGHRPAVAGVHGGQAGMLRDGHRGDHGAPLQPQVGRDVPQRHVLRLLGRRPPVRGGQPGHRRLAHHRGSHPRHIIKPRTLDRSERRRLLVGPASVWPTTTSWGWASWNERK